MNTPRIRKGKQYYEKPQNGCFARRRFSTQSQEPEKLLLTFQANKIKFCQIRCLLFHNNDIVIMIWLQWYCLQRGCAEEFAPAGRDLGCHFYANMNAVPCKYVCLVMQICMPCHANMYALPCKYVCVVPCKSLIVKHIAKKKLLWFVKLYWIWCILFLFVIAN